MNAGKANQAAIRLLICSVGVLGALFLLAWLGFHIGGFILAHPWSLFVPWAVFLVAVLLLSRDPDPIELSDLNSIVSPAHGKVDVIEDTVEAEFMQGACKRISIRIALSDVQVQNAPVAGTIARCEHQFAQRKGTPARENLFLGFEVVGRPQTRVGVRIFGGTWGRRIVPWVKAHNVVPRSARLGMTRPGSRVDLFLSPEVKLLVQAGDVVTGGQSVVGKFE